MPNLVSFDALAVRRPFPPQVRLRVRGLAAWLWVCGALLAQQQEVPPRVPVPSGAALAEAKAAVDYVYGEQRAAAQSPDDVRRLVVRLIAIADETEPPSERFAVLDLALGLAGERGLVRESADVARRIAAAFEVDDETFVIDAIAGAARSSTDASATEEAQELLVDLGTAAFARAAMGQASRALDAAYEATPRTDRADRARMNQYRQLLQRAVKAHEGLEGAAAPDAAKHHQALGLYHCLVAGDWVQGLEHLAVGSAAKLAGVAAADLAAPTDPAEMVALADRWADLAKGPGSKLEGEAWAGRAMHWLGEALPQLSGLLAKTVEKRIEELRGDAGDAGDEGGRPRRGGAATNASLPRHLRHAAENVRALREHRPKVCDGMRAELDAVVQAAGEGNSRAYRSALAAALAAAAAKESEVRSDKGGRNAVGDIVAVLEAMQKGKWDLRELPIHRRNHLHENGVKPELRGLPGLVYSAEDARRAVVYHGDWRIDGDELVVARVDDKRHSLVFGDPGWTDYDFTVEVEVGTDVDGAGVFVHCNGYVDYAVFGVAGYDNAYQELACWKEDRWSKLQQRPGVLEADRWHQVRVQVRGARITCFLDGTQLFDAEDPNHSTGRVGLSSWTKGSAAPVRFRAIRVQAPDGRELFSGLPQLDD
ncbi:MAG: family 16 glycoside hydrolase [Planctomycetota bacterium]